MIKAGYKDPNFKFEKTFATPSGLQWEKLRAFLKNQMDAADFRTLWKGVASAVPICSKALTMKNIHSAFDDTGAITLAGVANVQSGLSTDPSSVVRILGGNLHFAGLSTDVAQKVLDLNPLLAAEVALKDFVSEEKFSELLSTIPGADNVEPVKEGHKGLNELAINR